MANYTNSILSWELCLSSPSAIKQSRATGSSTVVNNRLSDAQLSKPGGNNLQVHALYKSGQTIRNRFEFLIEFFCY